MAEYKHSVCPVWIGYLLASPVRNLYHHPKGIIGPYVKRGMTVLDFGCAMGFFSLAMARAVGPSGRVIAVDVQEKMVESLTKRAKRAGLAEIIEPYVCPPDTVGLKGRDGTIDFILAFAVVHEVPDPRRLFGEFFRLLKLEGKLLLAEPKGHVSEEAFERTLAIAGESGLSPLKNLKIFKTPCRSSQFFGPRMFRRKGKPLALHDFFYQGKIMVFDPTPTEFVRTDDGEFPPFYQGTFQRFDPNLKTGLW